MAYGAGEAIVCEVNPVGADKIVLWANKVSSIDGPRTKARFRDDQRDPLPRQAITDASSPEDPALKHTLATHNVSVQQTEAGGRAPSRIQNTCRTTSRR